MNKLRFTSVLIIAALIITACSSDFANEEMEPETSMLKTRAKKRVKSGGEGDPIIDYRSKRFINAGSENITAIDSTGTFGCYVYWEKKSLRSIDMNNRLNLRPIDGYAYYYQGDDPNVIIISASAIIDGPIDINQNADIKVEFIYSKKIFYYDNTLHKDTFLIVHPQIIKSITHYFSGVDENNYANQ